MLVTIVVVTYNSSKYVLQTLESAYRQTYGEIELLVSDDCSQDNTVQICKDWVNEHKDRFVSAKVYQTQENGGICHNYNFALSLSNGEYIKYIAGDDILEDHCIESFVNQIDKQIHIYSCCTTHYFVESGDRKQYCTPIRNQSAFRQARSMLKNVYAVEGSSLFFERSSLVELGGFDMNFPMLEDWPIVMRYLTSHQRIKIIHNPLVVWRVYESSVSHSNQTFSQSLGDSVDYYLKNNLLKYGLIFHYYSYWVKKWIGKNYHKGVIKRTLCYFLRIFDVVYQYRKIRPVTYYRLIEIE